jgi:5'-nucleotidase/UDP-sugar diphosphatase
VVTVARTLATTILLATTLVACRLGTHGAARAEMGADPVRAPIVRGTCDQSGSPAHFTLAHLNDLQARYDELPGGKNRYGYIAGYLRSIKSEEPNTLVLDAGDDYEKGSIAELRSLGETTRRMVQALPIDVRTIGNHDFAYGEAAVRRDVQLSSHPVLAANIRVAHGRTPFLPYVEARVGCVRVGVVGLVTGHYGSDDQPDDAAFDGVFIHDSDYVRVLREQVEKHRGEVDVMIALTHLGFYTDAELGAQVPDVDVIIGGHSEDLLPNGQPYQRPGGRVGWIFQAGHYGEHVGRADFTFDRGTHTLRLQRYQMADIDEHVPYAEDVGRTAHALVHAFTPDAERPIAIAGTAVQLAEMPGLVMRAARDRWAVDALFIGKDDFWSGLPSGPITLQRLYDTVLVQREPSGTPGFTSLYIVTMSGADLLDLRQHQNAGYVTLFAGRIAPDEHYRVAVDKRAIEHPATVASGGFDFPEHRRFGGELIDVLDAYARARTSRGLTL